MKIKVYIMHSEKINYKDQHHAKRRITASVIQAFVAKGNKQTAQTHNAKHEHDLHEKAFQYYQHRAHLPS